MASRSTTSGASTPPVSGPDFLNEYSARVGTLFDASALPLTAIGGTADAVTATLDPALGVGGLVDGMKFTLTWAASNTAGVTLALNGAAAIAVVGPDGTALAAGSVGSGLRSLIEYIGGSFRILSPLLTSLGGGSQRYYWQFTASGTWNKPAGLDDNTIVTFEAWGAGGGGARSATGTTPAGGGGGGAYVRRQMRLADVPSSVAITIGSGGAGGVGTGDSGATGGNTSAGTLVTAYGGGGGGLASGGGGGGEMAAGNTSGTGGRIGGGDSNGTSGPSSPYSAKTIWGGAAGGGADNNTGSGGGWAVYGGGGGGAGNTGGSLGGTSIFGGNGGAGGDASPLPTAGVAPGGGGGAGIGVAGAAGARGEVRVWI